MVLRKCRLGEPDLEFAPVFGGEAISLAPVDGAELPACGALAPCLHARGDPLRVRAQAFEMIELPEDFRDLLLALHDADAEFVVVGDGVLQMGVPPFRIDILNRAGGIS